MFPEARGPRTWQATVQPSGDSDVALGLAELPGLAGYAELQFGIVVLVAYAIGDLPDINVYASMDGVAYSQTITLLTAASVALKGTITTGYKAYSATVDLSDTTEVLPASRYFLTCQYKSGRTVANNVALPISLIARLC